MITLANDTLEVFILDPIADQERFGTRYCTGGYIFQIADKVQGDLLSGPTFPDEFNWFDGQGIPDAFNKMPLVDDETSSSLSLVPGIGLCDLKEDSVSEFCVWEVTSNATSVTMSTTHDHQGFSLDLTRTVSVSGRTIRSHTAIQNTGKRHIPLSWFPHPFYPQPETNELCKFNIPVSFPDNEGFEFAESGFIQRKTWPWGRGYYQALDHNAESCLTVYQKHPKLGIVAATCSYVPNFFPVWGNPNTFSWEPYLERIIARGQPRAWHIDYEF